MNNNDAGTPRPPTGKRRNDDQIPVTVMVFTLNEERNLPGCLESISWSDDIIVVDSYSTDSTRTICETRNVRFFQHAFEGFGSQRNWAFAHTSPKHEWILVLDADERVPPELAEEIGRVVSSATEKIAAYRLRRRLFMWGRWLRYSGLYPTWVIRLVRRDRVRYIDRGHAETQVVDGQIRELDADLMDENLKGIDEWFARQNRYSRADADYEIAQAKTPLRLMDLLSGDPLVRRAVLKRVSWRMPIRPAWYFLYTYILRGGFLEGRDGFRFCMMRAMYQAMVSMKKYDAKRWSADQPELGWREEGSNARRNPNVDG